jgi:putative transposase
MNWSISPHRPPHLYVDDACYFISASTVDKARILSTDKHYELWIRAFKELIAEFNAKPAAWVVLANHYHFLFLPQRGIDLGKFMKRLSGRTSREFNLLDNAQGRPVWYSYWDVSIRGEGDFWTRFNYIHNNPVKHGYVERTEDWHYSSYHQDAESNPDWLTACFQEFPVLNLFEDDLF